MYSYAVLYCAYHKKQVAAVFKNPQNGGQVIKGYASSGNQNGYSVSKHNGLFTSGGINPQGRTAQGCMLAAVWPADVLKLGTSVVVNIRQHGFESPVMPQKKTC